MAKDKENKPTDVEPTKDVANGDGKLSRSESEAGDRNRDTQQVSSGDKATNVVADSVNVTHNDSTSDDNTKAVYALSCCLVVIVGLAFYFLRNPPVIEEEGEMVVEAVTHQSNVPVADMEARIAYDRRLLTKMIEQIERVKRGLGTNLSYGKFEDAETDLKKYKFSEDRITEKNTAILAFVRGGIRFLEHDYEEAAKFYKEAVENAKTDYKFEYLTQLGTTQLELGLDDEALKTFEAALATSSSEEQKAIGNNNLGKARRIIGDDLDSAIAAFEVALEIRKEEDGEEHQLVASIYNNLAVTYDDQLQCNKAQDMYKAALGVYKEALGDLYDKSREVANTLSNKATSLGSIHCKKRKNLNEEQLNLEIAEAKENLTEAIEIRKRIVGEDHPSVAMDYCNLSTLLWDDQKVTDKTEAIGLHNKCRDIFIAKLPDSHSAIHDASVELINREDFLESR